MRLLASILTFLCVAGPAAATTHHVDLDATGANDGSSWADAFVDLQSALNGAAHGDEIWVAEGVYYPTTRNTRGSVFWLSSGVQLYGGFDGTETQREARDPELHRVILSGDLGQKRPDGEAFQPGDAWTLDNAYRVVLIANADATTVLDGVTVQEGSRGIDVIWGQPKVRNCVVRYNFDASAGGGVLIRSNGRPELTNMLIEQNANWMQFGAGVNSERGSFPRLDRVVIRENSAGLSGGGMAGSGELTNVVFADNASGAYGGGLWSTGSISLQNVCFTGNEAQEGGAFHIGRAVHTSSSVPASGPAVAVNLTVSGNTSASGSMLSVDGTTLELKNSILASATPVEWIVPTNATVSVANSLLEGSGGSGAGWNATWGDDLGGNLDTDPGFVGGGDLRLLAVSPAIDAGNTAAIADVTTDLDGNPRVQGEGVDMGAFEFQGEPEEDEPEAVGFAAQLNPRTLNVKSNGRFVELELHGGVEAPVTDVDPQTLVLDGIVPSLRSSLEDGVLYVKFERAALAALFERDGEYEVEVSGALFDGSPLNATAALRVIGTGDDRHMATGAVGPVRATPNPFNPATEISFRLEAGGPVELAIYDLAGRRVKTLLRGALAPGEHREMWRGLDDSGRRVASGTYFAHLRTSDGERVGRLILVK